MNTNPNIFDPSQLNLPNFSHKIVTISEALSAMTAGTAYTGILTYSPVVGSSEYPVGYFKSSSSKNTSFTPDGSVFVTEVSAESKVLSRGQYYIDYLTGYYKVIAAASATPTVTYKIRVPFNLPGTEFKTAITGASIAPATDIICVRDVSETSPESQEKKITISELAVALSLNLEHPDTYFCGSQITTTLKPFYKAADLQACVTAAAADGIKKVKVLSNITLEAALVLKNGVDIDAEGFDLTCGLTDNGVATVATVKAKLIYGGEDVPGLKTSHASTIITAITNLTGGYDEHFGSGTNYGAHCVNGQQFITGNVTGGASTLAAGAHGALCEAGYQKIVGNCYGAGDDGAAGSGDGAKCTGGIQIVIGDCTGGDGGITPGEGSKCTGGSQTIIGNSTGGTDNVGSPGSAAGVNCAGGTQTIEGNCTAGPGGGVVTTAGAKISSGTLFIKKGIISTPDAAAAKNALEISGGSCRLGAGVILLNEHADGLSIYSASAQNVIILGTIIANRNIGVNITLKVGDLIVSSDVPSL
jgi:hypothetical protein